MAKRPSGTQALLCSIHWRSLSSGMWLVTDSIPLQIPINRNFVNSKNINLCLQRDTIKTSYQECQNNNKTLKRLRSAKMQSFPVHFVYSFLMDFYHYEDCWETEKAFIIIIIDRWPPVEEEITIIDLLLSITDISSVLEQFIYVKLCAYTATYIFKIFQGSLPPDPFNTLACPFGWIGPHLNLCRLLCFIGRLWKLLLRTLIRYRESKTRIKRLHHGGFINL